jgi:hypothetical protein
MSDRVGAYIRADAQVSALATSSPRTRFSNMAKKSKNDPPAVDAYLATLARAERESLEQLRTIIKETIPRVEERVSYGTTVMFSRAATWWDSCRSQSICRSSPQARSWRKR